MVKMTYKKRKNVKKQSFKKRNKKMKGGGPDDVEVGTEEKKEEPTAGTDATTASTEVKDANATDANATTTEGSSAPIADVKKEETTDANANEVKEGASDANAESSSDPVADDNAETPVADDSWKDGVSEEEVKAAEEKVKNIEEMGEEKINNLAKELANAPGTPLWAKALAKSGAAGKAAKFLNAHPELKKALIDKGIKMVENANVSGDPQTTASTDGNTTPTGNPEEDAGYKQFLEDLKANPNDTLRKNVYIWPSVEGLYVYDGEKWVNHKDEVIEDDTAATATATTDNKEGAAADGTKVQNDGDAAGAENKEGADADGTADNKEGADVGTEVQKDSDATATAAATTAAATTDNKEGDQTSS